MSRRPYFFVPGGIPARLVDRFVNFAQLFESVKDLLEEFIGLNYHVAERLDGAGVLFEADFRIETDPVEGIFDAGGVLTATHSGGHARLDVARLIAETRDSHLERGDPGVETLLNRGVIGDPGDQLHTAQDSVGESGGDHERFGDWSHEQRQL